MRSTWLPPIRALVLSIVLLPMLGATSPNWQLVEDDKGIKVWSLEIPGQNLPGFRGITSVNVPLERLMRYFLDVAKHTEWMHECEESRIVKRLSSTRAILYNRINSPWPVQDRDVLLDVDHRYTPQHTAVTFRFRNTNDYPLPVPEGVVRIPRLQGFYRLWQESSTRTNVLYQVEVDVGGKVPAGLARRYARSLPFETLAKLRKNVEALEP